MLTSRCVLTLILSTVLIATASACCIGAKPRDRLVAVLEDIYYMAFRIQPGINLSARARFMDAGHNDDDDPMQFDFGVPCGCKTTAGDLRCDRHFRSRILDQWEQLPIYKVRLGIYQNHAEKQYFLFDGQNSTSTNWFSKSRLLSSSYTDFTSADVTGFFSITSDGESINNDNACPNGHGWLRVLDGPNADCSWQEPVDSYPVVYYSPSNTASKHGDDLERAHVLTVSVSMKADHCYGMAL